MDSVLQEAVHGDGCFQAHQNPHIPLHLNQTCKRRVEIQRVPSYLPGAQFHAENPPEVIQ